MHTARVQRHCLPNHCLSRLFKPNCQGLLSTGLPGDSCPSQRNLHLPVHLSSFCPPVSMADSLVLRTLDPQFLDGLPTLISSVIEQAPPNLLDIGSSLNRIMVQYHVPVILDERLLIILILSLSSTGPCTSPPKASSISIRPIQEVLITSNAASLRLSWQERPSFSLLMLT